MIHGAFQHFIFHELKGFYLVTDERLEMQNASPEVACSKEVNK